MLFYFVEMEVLEMTEQEIADYYHLVQSTVHYHKAESLRMLKDILE